MDRHFYAVIPAGGSGSRLWPMSRASKPKFLLPLPGPRTLIQETVSRLAPLSGIENISVVTGHAHVGELETQLPDLTRAQLIVEPMPRGSGPAIGLATAIACANDPEAIVGSFAADHIVKDIPAFHAAVRSAIALAESGYLVTIGIQPTYPETGYGYIAAGESLGQYGELDAFHVSRFKEKPDLDSARSYVASGTYLWNASMFVWKAQTLLDEMRRFLPSLSYAVERIAAYWGTPQRHLQLADIWPSVEDVSIDQGILERSERVAVVPASFGWSDVGDWHGLGSVVGNGSDSTVVLNAERLVTLDVERSVVMGNGRVIGLIGLEDMIVVDTPDALLVCPRARAQDVKALVAELKRRGAMGVI
jgi:mannose-1-phosphate guanylyltransferase